MLSRTFFSTVLLSLALTLPTTQAIDNDSAATTTVEGSLRGAAAAASSGGRRKLLQWCAVGGTDLVQCGPPFNDPDDGHLLTPMCVNGICKNVKPDFTAS